MATPVAVGVSGFAAQAFVPAGAPFIVWHIRQRLHTLQYQDGPRRHQMARRNG
jgi:hypothetical protein